MNFPLFIDLTGKQVTVIGGGNIATRRVRTLLSFDCKISVIAPKLSDALQELSAQGCIKHICSIYSQEFIKGSFIVIGATNDRTVNHCVYQDATEQNILVNIIDSKAECSFFFPAIVETSELIGGLISKSGSQHKLVKNTAVQIRTLLNGGN